MVYQECQVGKVNRATFITIYIAARTATESVETHEEVINKRGEIGNVNSAAGITVNVPRKVGAAGAVFRAYLQSANQNSTRIVRGGKRLEQQLLTANPPRLSDYSIIIQNNGNKLEMSPFMLYMQPTRRWIN